MNHVANDAVSLAALFANGQASTAQLLEQCIARIDATTDSIQVQFIPNPPVDAAKIITLIQRNHDYKLSGPDRLKIQVQILGVAERVIRIKNLLKELTT